MGREAGQPTSIAEAFGRLALALAVMCCAPPVIASDDLTEMSLEELMNIEVTSVSRKSESKNEAAAAVTVITAEDLRRGGFTTVPEALRVVPGVQVARIDASRWAISIRGFRQEFSNKLLVMIDGRSIYTPVFGGVVWSEHNIAMENIDRIEVIRGPGGAIWGANAVNGVINIISKKAKDTQGIRAHVFGGTQEYGIGLRYGGAIGDHTEYRVSGKAEKVEDFDFNQNYNADDEWGQLRFGFRSDTELSEKDDLTVIADYFDLDLERGRGIADAAPPFDIVRFAREDQSSRGGNLQLKYGHEFEGGSQLVVKTYYDQVSRRTTIEEDSRTFDLEAQHEFEVGDHLGFVWGADYRFWTTHVQPGLGSGTFPPITFDPNDEDYHLGSGFVQVQVDLFDDKLTLTGGTKLEYNSWSGFEYQPSARVAIKPIAGHTLWAAVSRAVRTPTYIDRSLDGPVGPATLRGDTDFRSEELLSIEGGYRFYQLEWLTAEVSAFYSSYDDFSSTKQEFPPNPFPNLQFANDGEIKVRGAEFELSLVPVDWVKLTAGYSVIDFFDERIPASPISSSEKKTQPRHQFVFRSFLALPGDVEFDASLYYVDGLEDVTPTLRPNNVTQYVRLDLRLGWKPLDWLELALVGQNLTDARHAEYNDIQRNESSQIPRSGYAKVVVDF